MGGNIFISYRRGDDPGNTGRLFDRLQEVFAPGQLFMDVDSIAPGLDFVRELEEQVAKCDVLLAVIGRGWVDACDLNGARRLDSQDDFVRIEIESALDQAKLVIPILVGGAQMPAAAELPEAIKPLARRNAVRLTHERFRADTQGLIKALQQALNEVEARRQSQDEALRNLQAEEERRKAAAKSLDVTEPKRVPEERTQSGQVQTGPGSRVKLLSRWNLKSALRIAGPIVVGLVASSAIFIFIASRPPEQPTRESRSVIEQPRQTPEEVRPAPEPPRAATPLATRSSEPPRPTAVLPSPPIEPPRLPTEQPVPRAEPQREASLAPPSPAIDFRPVPGEWAIQVGAFPTEDEARVRLHAVQRLFEGNYPDAQFYTDHVIKGSHELYRARVLGFITRDAADNACRLLKRKDVACISLKP